MYSALSRALLGAVMACSLAACGGGEGGDVVDGLGVAQPSGGARSAAAMQPDWAASSPRTLSGAEGLSQVDPQAFAHAACAEAGCTPTEAGYLMADRHASYGEYSPMVDETPPGISTEEAASRYAYMAADSQTPGAGPHGME